MTMGIQGDRIVTMRKIFDAHFHGREGTVLKLVTEQLNAVAGYATYMPNLGSPVVTGAHVVNYENEINKWAADTLHPIMTLYLTPETTADTILQASLAGAKAAKLYPVVHGGKGETTTNAGHGISVKRAALRNYRSVLKMMESLGMLLLIHGEVPHGDTFKRERRFLKTLRWLTKCYPRLKIVLEHITTAEAVKAVQKLPYTVAATITVHHLLLTRNDVVGDKITPHHFCKPIAKQKRDRRALRRAAVSGNPKFFFGSDSAPHARDKKECAEGCAGVYSAPVMLPLLVALFRQYNALSLLEDFTSTFGCFFYGLPLPTSTVTLKRETWKVPEQYGGIVPFFAGRTLFDKVVS